MRKKPVLTVKLFFSFLVTIRQGFQFAHQLVVQIFSLVVFLASHSLLIFKLAMQKGVGLFKFGDGLLQGDIFGFNLLELLLEMTGFLVGRA